MSSSAICRCDTSADTIACDPWKVPAHWWSSTVTPAWRSRSAYFECSFNASAAAAKLKVNDRTIAYRLNIVEQLLGRPVRARQTELQAAIRLERVLGQP
jgi:hypothetical protein